MKKASSDLVTPFLRVNITFFRLFIFLLVGSIIFPALTAAQIRRQTESENLLFSTIFENAPRWSPFAPFSPEFKSFTNNDRAATPQAAGVFDNSMRSPTAQNGKIAFVSDLNGNYEIYTMNADGTLVTNITNTAADGEDSPSWSPDGVKIVYTKNGQIWTMSADGGNKVRINNTISDAGQIAWSPTGAKFVFVRGSNLWTMNADGSSPAQLTTNGFLPAWSPDSSKIVFSSQFTENSVFKEEIFTIDITGANLTRLTNDNFNLDRFASFSPDGAKILFNSNRDAGANTANWKIYTMDATGGSIARITNNSVQDAYPVWSPDGTKIGFERRNINNKFDVFTMNAAGGGEIQITNNNANNFSPAWQPLVPTLAPSINGTVTENGGTPVQNAVVTLTGTGISGSITATTDFSGNYNFSDLTAGGNYTLSLDPQIFMSPPQNVTDLQSNQTVNFSTVRALYTIGGTINRSATPNAPQFQVQLSGDNGQILSAMSGPTGSYSFPQVQAGRNYRIMPSPANGYSTDPAFRDIIYLNGNRTAENFTAVGCMISGNIARGGAALAGATVVLSGGSSGSTTTDASGNYSFVVGCSFNYTVTPQLSNHVFTPASRTFNSIFGNQIADFTATVQPTANYSIDGRVVADDGGGLSGVTVYLSGTNISGSISTGTNSSGNYQFDDLTQGGNYTVTPDPNHPIFNFGSPQSVFNLQSSATINFTGTRRNYTVNGTVRYGFSNNFAALSGATVTLRNLQNGQTVGTMTTDSNGSYFFNNVPAGRPYSLTPTRSGFTFAPVFAHIQNLTQNESRTFEVATTNAGIYGRVGFFEAGNFTPLPNVTINLSGATSASITTDSAGFYQFVNLNAGGNYTVSPQDTALADFSPVSIQNLQNNQTLDINGTRQIYVIGGNITASGNQPLPNATVTLRRASDNAVVGTTATGQNGNYIFNGVPAGFNYSVTPQLSGYAFNPLSASVANLSAPVGGVNFIAVAPTVVYTISGNVRAEGANLSGAFVALSGTESATTTTDANGNYSFDVTSGGSYSVSVAKPNFNFNPASQSFSNLQANQNADFQNGIPFCAPPPSNLIAWYKGEANALDSSGNNLNAALQNNPVFSPNGRVGQTFEFNGTSQYAQIAHSDSFNSNNLTVGAWVNTDTLASESGVMYRDIVSKYDSALGASFSLDMEDGGAMTFWIYNNPNSYRMARTNAPVLTIGQWKHVYATFDLATQDIKIYVNGIAVPVTVSGATISAVQQNTVPVRIGAFNQSGIKGFWDGKIDEAQVFSRALSALEIQAIYNAGGAGMCQTFTPTPTGANVTVNGSNASLLFGSVTQSGTTTTTTIAPASIGALPAGFTLPPSPQQIAFDVNTSAAFAGAIDLSVNVPNVPSATACANLRMLHFNSMTNRIEDITLPPNQYDSGAQICVVKGRATSLSPFVVAQAVAPTAAAVTIGGRVLTRSGEGIRNAFVTLTDESGNSQTVYTGKSGYYRFASVAAGRTYVISARAKRYTFSQPTQVRIVTEDLTDVNFTANE